MSDNVWMRDPDGVYAHVAKDGVDTWTPRGLQKADEPTRDDAFVWMHHDEIDGTAKLPWGAREYWQGRGWAFSPPEEPVDLTKDPALADVEPEKPAKKAADKTPAAKKTAASSEPQE
jgi:hypothetical protein